MLHTKIDKELISRLMERLRDMVSKTVQKQFERALSEHRFKKRSVIPHTEVPRYFGDRVSEARVREYIRGKDLPQGTELPLPATKKGNLYFIEVGKLEQWQAGKCAREDLSAWQKERLRKQPQ